MKLLHRDPSIAGEASASRRLSAAIVEAFKSAIPGMKTLVAAAALAITGAVTVQAADIFSCGALGYATHDGRVERICSAPVTTHWMKLGERFSALVYYRDEPDGLHVVVTTQPGVSEKAAVERSETVLAAGQSAAVSIPRAAGQAPERVVLSNAGGHLHIAEPPSAVSAQ